MLIVLTFGIRWLYIGQRLIQTCFHQFEGWRMILVRQVPMLVVNEEDEEDEESAEGR